jgi:ferrous iron transport protein B
MEHGHQEPAFPDSAQGEPLGLLVGNPNVGKSVLFNQLTGRYAVVSNYPGTTIELMSARMNLPDGSLCLLIDTPGINGLLPFSEDEKVTQRIILERDPAFMIQVADSKNLARTLQLTYQFLDLDVPLVLALNMSDEAARKGLVIDEVKLARLLGVPVTATAAPRGEGVVRLRELIPSAGHPPRRSIYPAVIERGLSELAPLFAKHPKSARLLAILVMARDPFIGEWLEPLYDAELLERVRGIADGVQSGFTKPLHLVMAQARDAAAAELARQVIRRPEEITSSLAERIGVITRQPLTGIPIFLFVLWLLYEIVGVLAAGTLVDFMEGTLFGEWVNPWIAGLFGKLPWSFVRDLFVGQFGLITMGLTYALAIVLPIVSTFFLCFGFLEDSGYLPRLSVISDRLFRGIGLNGKAILPMVLGLGCGTMATLTARILETRKERLIVTLLLALGIPCSAQLGVMLAIMSALSLPAVLTVIGVLLLQLLLVGWVAALVLPGEKSDFILEIPPIRLPRLSNILRKTFLRVDWFLREAIPLFLIGTFVLFLADRFGLLALLVRGAEPVVSGWLRLPAETATVFIMGFFRRDYGAAQLFQMVKENLVTPNQMVISLVVLTLFIPCVANFLVIIKEQGWRKAVGMAAFIFPFAVLVGGLLGHALDLLGIVF